MSSFDFIDKALDISRREDPPVEKKKELTVPKTNKELEELKDKHRKEDYIKTRENTLTLLDNMIDVIEGAATEIKAAPSARFFETFALLAKTFYDINKDFQETSLGKVSSDESDPEEKKPSTMNNFIFNGTSENLLDALKRGV